jgi:tetratricopeptide (TPR) repeat protein
VVRLSSPARAAFALLLTVGLLTGCGSTNKSWLARGYQNTHALFNGYYHADLRYREAVKSAEQQYIPPAEGFIPLVDGTDGADFDQISSATFSSAAPLASVPLPDAQSGMSNSGAAFGGQNGGPSGGGFPGATGRAAELPGTLNQPSGVNTVPAANAQRGPQASLFTSDVTAFTNWGPGGSKATTAAGLLDESMRKCEYMIFKRPNSNWVDDSRLLMAKCAFQLRNYGFALQNLDYILATFPKSDLTQEVLLWQAKINYQYENNLTSRAQLQKALATPGGDREIRLTCALLLAQLLTRDGETNKAIAVLDDNLELLRTRKDKCRVNYLLGQLYDARGNYTAAYTHFTEAAKVNYSTLMSFRSQLALINLQIKYQPDVERGQQLRRELAQMARQGRFSDFHDQIEYQLGLQALKEKNIPAAEKHLLTSLAKNDPKANPEQRTTTYYELGRMYFYSQSRLDRAQAYFDSAVRTAKPESRDYRRIQAYAKSLKDYIRYREQAAAADSLLALSKLSEGELAREVNESLEREDELREQAAALAEARAAQAATAERNRQNDAALRGPADPTGLGIGEFYFDNAASVARGKAEFARLWGKRPNVDNWRRGRSISNLPLAPDEDTLASAQPAVAAVQGKAERRAAALAKVPRTPEQVAKQEATLADGLYGLAQVFSEQLQMPDSARRVHEQILRRFGAGSEVAPRSLYALYRLGSASKDPKAPGYADQLIENFPNSPFTRLARQQRAGSSLIVEVGDFESGYSTAFGLYARGDFSTSSSLSGFLLGQYASHPDAAKLVYLHALALGRQGLTDSLRVGLEQLLAAYPTSTLAAQARLTLEALKTGVTGKAKLDPLPGQDLPKPNLGPTRATLTPDADLDRAFVSSRAPGEKVFALLLVDQSVSPPDPLRELFEKFNVVKYAGRSLTTSVFTTLDKHLVYVSQFDNYASGKAYLDAVLKDPALSRWLPQPEERIMLATATNFRIAFTQRRFNDYVRYYRAHIAQWLTERP